MSAAMFTPPAAPDKQSTPLTPKPATRIPVPLSPTLPQRRPSLRRAPSGVDRSPNGGANSKGVASTPTLRRGNSWSMEGSAPPTISGRPPRRPDSVRLEGSRYQQKGQVGSAVSPNRVRSLSLSLSNTRLQSGPNTPSSVATNSPSNPTSASDRNFSVLDRWETDSINSIGSSVASCDHESFARNGTTFSGRSMKFVFHCNQHSGATGEDYLTPTQRAQRQVKKLKYLLHQAKKDLEEKDSDILKLTKEVVELRLYKAALSSPEDKSNSSDAVTVRENTSQEVTPEDLVDKGMNMMSTSCDYNHSCADSGHFEDCTTSSVHSKDSMLFDDHRSPIRSRIADKSTATSFEATEIEAERSKLIMEYEKRLQELVRTHEEESYQLKQKHNDKVEELLQRITEINTRYWELVPEIEAARERIKELEQQLEEASQKLEDQERKAQETYLKMYAQGQEAAKIEQESAIVELAHQHPSRVSVPELLQELQVTKNELENIKAMYRQLMEAKNKNKIDPEVTLQFLKSAVYYFLTDKENSQGHLRAIQSILGFSQSEISNIDKARLG
ncbi:unnamed protein product [Acanthoscelides obtectus]|uniref:GRIP domain-containing protein n=1 Tax=Acanthoscelides obtectus TaxID=200917 RepID=A0A9P0PHS3_ACAOB|nr:unnamed protein product [Acanthoscelides obtectus]CAK1675009.1 hypothetical protein AOBTE_LOCUS29854 [Acanthoscelides obtectus]